MWKALLNCRYWAAQEPAWYLYKVCDLVWLVGRRFTSEIINILYNACVCGCVFRAGVCDACSGPMFGPGLKLIRPFHGVFGLQFVPVMFLCCSPACLHSFRNHINEQPASVWSDKNEFILLLMLMEVLQLYTSLNHFHRKIKTCKILSFWLFRTCIYLVSVFI